MASSSSSSIHKSFRYDVFLSFRGKDTRTNFVDHLYRALQEKGIYTYKDNERIKKGKMVNDELIVSIEDSRFYIIVFSKNYASSSWCLDELVKIMECHKTAEHTAYPVFYDVEPTEVRKQSGAVGEAFSKHEKEEAAGKWRKALEEAAGLAGWELKNTTNGHEAKFIQKVIEEISLELRSISFNFDEKLVGLETRVTDVISSLEIGIDDVRMIGIKGMGGAGKTTLARAVFDQISFQFEGKSFVENVREVSTLSGLKSLQKQILADVLNDKDICVSTVHDGKNMMKRRMRGKKVLIVVDDIDDINQLEALAGEPNWFKPESRIIITTRDEKVLVAHRVTLIHDINLLSDKEAICLFSRYAFRKDIPIQGYQELSEQVVRYAAGLPLTITVLGSFLCGEDKPEWEDALARLKTIPLAKTQEILELSYIVLEDDYKQIFLDVACIMKGWSKDIAIKALESCGFHAKIGLRVLQQKSLITIKGSPGDELLGMHDSIEEMGRNIVRRSHPDMPQKHSRLWKDDEIEHILANDMGTEETRCIHFYSGNHDPYILMEGLGKMKSLRFLSMEMRDYSTNPELNTFSQSFPEALRYLTLFGYPFRSLPITFQANNLVTLQLHNSGIVQLWEGGERKVLKKLRFLEISLPLLRTLDLGLAPNLETLSLRRCGSLVELLGANRMLKHLKSLELYDCLLLEKLPEDLGQLRCLEELKFSYTSIKHLPDSICMLNHLKSLELNGCLLLEKLPEDLGQLECLEELSLSYTNIKNLPDSISMLKHLRNLKIDNCQLLEELPEDLGQLRCLEELNLSSTNIKHLPDSICMLKQLISLKLNGCLLLKKLPEDLGGLESLEVLLLSFTEIRHLPNSICRLKRLNDFQLAYCSLLEELPEDLSGLQCLNNLDLSKTKIKHLPDSSCMLKELKYLTIKDCVLFEKLPEDLGQLSCLEKLELWSTNIAHLPDSICMLKHLKDIHLNECLSFVKLPEDLGRLECLEKLKLWSTNITHLPDSICMLKHLIELDLTACELLEKLPENFGQLECLKSLHLVYVSIKHLPDSIVMLKNLTHLCLDRCLSFEKLPDDLGRLECLEELQLSYTKIRHLPDSICELKHLENLKFDHCSWLEQLPKDLGRLECLKELQLSSTNIGHLTNSICELKRLRSLNLSHCSLLEKLPEELGYLKSLEILYLEGACISHLPQSILLRKGLIIYGSREFLQSFGFTSKLQAFKQDGKIRCYVEL